MAKGGKQPGAGRPKGSTNLPKIRDYLTTEQINDMVAKTYDLAIKGDATLLKFLGEQVFGKALQPLSGLDGGALVVQFDKSFNATPRKATRRSSK